MKSSGEPLQDLRQTPAWRWLLYLIVFGGVIGLMGFKLDRQLLWILPIAIAFVGIWLVGTLHLFIHSARFRLGYLWLLRLVVAIIFVMLAWRIIQFVKIMNKNNTDERSSNNILHGTSHTRRP
jgi:hypothetical protein